MAKTTKKPITASVKAKIPKSKREKSTHKIADPLIPPKITFVNVTSHKGGAGKSTISLLLAAEISRTSESTKPRKVFLLDLDFTGTSLTSFAKMPTPTIPSKFEGNPLIPLESTITHKWTFGEEKLDLTPLISTPFPKIWEEQNCRFSDNLSRYKAEEKFSRSGRSNNFEFFIVPSSVNLKTTEDILLAEPFANIIQAKVFLLIKQLISEFPGDELYFLFDHSPGIFPLAKTFLAIETGQIRDFLGRTVNDPKREVEVKDVFVFTPDLQDIVETFKLINFIEEEKKKKDATTDILKVVFVIQNLAGRSGIEDEKVKKNLLALVKSIDSKIATPPDIKFSLVPRSGTLTLFSAWATISGEKPGLEPFPALPPGLPGIAKLAQFVTGS